MESLTENQLLSVVHNLEEEEERIQTKNVIASNITAVGLPLKNLRFILLAFFVGLSSLTLQEKEGGVRRGGLTPACGSPRIIPVMAEDVISSYHRQAEFVTAPSLPTGSFQNDQCSLTLLGPQSRLGDKLLRI